MAGSLLDIYGNYEQANKLYQDRYNSFMNEVNAYNKAGQAWNQAVKDYNASSISDRGAYDNSGNYVGGGPYTMYNGYRLGRTGTPVSTYQTDPIGYNTVTDYNNITGYDQEGSPQYGSSQVPYYGGTNETTYVDPNTGLASIFPTRPADEFTMTAPTAPEAPIAPEGSGYQGTSNISPEELYQKQFGRSTPDVLSNEAWSLANLTSPFLNSEAGTIYETGGLSQMNNPLSYVGPDALTTGQVSQPGGSYIGTENKYY